MKITSCRFCKYPLTTVLKLGKMPTVNHFLSAEDLKKREPKFPLNLCFCEKCALVQIDEVVPPEKLFRHYHYLTAASQPLVEHFRGFAEECRDRHYLGKGSKCVDIGANDGTLLFQLQHHGAETVMGIDPSLNAIEAAKKIGIKVVPYMFSEKTAKQIAAEYGKFSMVTGTNVFAHTHEIESFLKGAAHLLKKDGVLILEFAHLLEMVAKTQFDVIYHEHISFFSLHALMPFFRKLGLEIFDAKKVLTQGGSLRIYARHMRGKKTGRITESMKAIIQEENENYLNELPTLSRFAADVRHFRTQLRDLIHQLKSHKKKIVGYGAPAKGVILLNYCQLGPRDISYLVDSTDLKQGKFFPGNHIPVFSEQKLENDDFDYVLLLSWNFQEVILKKLETYRKKGVKVIIPFPKLRVI